MLCCCIRKSWTHHQALDDIASAETVGDLDLVLFCGSHVLNANDAVELFACGERDAIDDGDRDIGLEGRETGDGPEDDGIGGRRIWAGAWNRKSGRCKVRHADDACSDPPVALVGAAAELGDGASGDGDWLAGQERRCHFSEAGCAEMGGGRVVRWKERLGGEQRTVICVCLP